MSADSEKPNIIGVIGQNIALWQNLWVGVGWFERRSSSARARHLRSAAGSIKSGRHILESRCAERCANNAFSTSFQATLSWQNTNLEEDRTYGDFEWPTYTLVVHSLKKKTATVSAFVRPLPSTIRVMLSSSKRMATFTLVTKAAEQVAKWRPGNQYFKPWTEQRNWLKQK